MLSSCFIMQAYNKVNKGSRVRGKGGERRGKGERGKAMGQGEGARDKAYVHLFLHIRFP